MKNKLLSLLFFATLFAACFENTTKEEQSELNEKEIQEETPGEDIQAEYIAKGSLIANEVQQVLGKDLMAAIQDSGVAYALQFCSERAYPITDSISNVYDIRIKRVSHKARNPANKANNEEKAIIHGFLEKQKQGETPQPILETRNSAYSFYSPILITMPTCLKCHGQVDTDIATEDYIILNTLYPQDQATGFKMGDLRGMWRIDFPKDYPL